MHTKTIAFASLATMALAFAPMAHGAPQSFAAPIQILPGGDAEALGQAAGYISPAIADIDGDGRMELIVGDLQGNVWVANRKSRSAVTGWGAIEAYKGTKNGKALKFKNW